MSDERTANEVQDAPDLAVESEDWLPEETKKKVARRKPDYFSPPPCDACQ